MTEKEINKFLDSRVKKLRKSDPKSAKMISNLQHKGRRARCNASKAPYYLFAYVEALDSVLR